MGDISGEVKAVTKAIALLSRISEAGASGVGVRALAREAGMPTSTVHRILHTLAASGVIRKSGSDTYIVGAALQRIGLSALNNLDIRNLAWPYINELQRATGETASLSVRTGASRCYVLQLESAFELKAKAPLGKPYPLLAGAPGVALLFPNSDAEIAELIRENPQEKLAPNTPVSPEQIWKRVRAAREGGYAGANQEVISGVSTIAAPVYSGVGEVAGALSVSAPLSRMDIEGLRRFAPLLLEATTNLSNSLGSIDNPEWRNFSVPL